MERGRRPAARALGVEADDRRLPVDGQPLVKAALGPWIEKGRVELAARIDGDPILAAIAAHSVAPRPQDALERAANAVERLEKRLGRKPTGLLPGAGALDAQIGPALGAAGAEWILIGPYAAPDEPWSAAGPSVLVPSGAAKIFDESVSTSSTFAADFASFEQPQGGWALAGELARAKKDAPADLSAAGAWPAWDASSAAPPAEGTAKEAWDAYGAAAKAVERFQNSGTADLNTLEAAVALLRRAQAARYYRPSEEEGVPAELKSALVAVYKRLRLPAPEGLYGGASAPGGSSDGPTGVKASAGPDWIEFRAPSGAVALSPPSPARRSPSPTAAPPPTRGACARCAPTGTNPP
ncbi:MAG: hypothetical protein M0D55_13895 [Elusimicrobiota bacterium]|nr:MAG: hypothetical protein M0D55_13895 [Elusimicrobiota bacterium]